MDINGRVVRFDGATYDAGYEILWFTDTITNGSFTVSPTKGETLKAKLDALRARFKENGFEPGTFLITAPITAYQPKMTLLDRIVFAIGEALRARRTKRQPAACVKFTTLR